MARARRSACSSSPKAQPPTAAKEAGAEFVGFEDMIKKCQEGFQDFDVAIATPAAMAEVRKLGKVLGPRGLMPNPKTGTVTDDTAKAMKEVKAGRVEFKLDKNGNVAVPVGKFSFAEEALVENGTAVIDAVVKARPAPPRAASFPNDHPRRDHDARYRAGRFQVSPDRRGLTLKKS